MEIKFKLVVLVEEGERSVNLLSRSFRVGWIGGREL